MLADKLSPKITMTVSGILVAIFAMSFLFLKTPDGWLTYVLYCLLSISFQFQGIALEGYFSKNIPKEVRGVLIGFLGFCGLIGRAIITKLGG